MIMKNKLIPIKEMPDEVRTGIKFVLTDIDDTMTTEGLLPSQSILALEILKKHKLKVVPVTGRPAGWCDHIARMWPVDGVIGENGAFYFRYDSKTKKVIRKFFKTPDELKSDRQKLNDLKETILKAVPRCKIASDQEYRAADLAIDFCEDVYPPLPDSDVNKIVSLFEKVGANAKVSSIHVNGWFGDYDKLKMTAIMFREEFGIDLDKEKQSIVFSGDSPNDAPMFSFFPNAVGVANVLDFKDRISCLPTWVTGKRAAAGFLELSEILTANR